MPTAAQTSFRPLRVFLCHASEDSARVREICDGLEAAGVTCWFDQRSLMVGDAWEREITRKIRESDAVIVCLSETALHKTTYLRTEINIILETASARNELAGFILPVKLEECDLPDEFARWQAYPYETEGLENILKALRKGARRRDRVLLPSNKAEECAWKKPDSSRDYGGIVEETSSYEQWLALVADLDQNGVMEKRRRMLADRFAFMRGSYFRWAQVWPRLCSELADAPLVVCAGDLHAACYQSWLDSQGRLAWGIRLFDEAFPLPYTNDLVRLAASILLAWQRMRFEREISFKDCCSILLEAYTTTINQGAEPYILAERHRWLEKLLSKPMEPKISSFQRYPQAEEVPSEVREALEIAFEEDMQYQILKRSSGVASLVWPKYLAWGRYQGGLITVTARFIPPPAAAWASGRTTATERYQHGILGSQFRVSEFRAGFWKGWSVSRISGNNRSLTWNSWDTEKLTKRTKVKLLTAFARELANLHLGTPGIQPSISKDLEQRESNWLAKSSKSMCAQLTVDFAEWRKAIADGQVRLE